MEGRIIVIKSSEELTSLDGDILNMLCYGLDIHILSMNHFTCEGDQVSFTNYINNKDRSKRVMFIPDSMINELRMVEDTYYTESRLSMEPCPTDPLDRFKWHCPVCNIEFHNM